MEKSRVSADQVLHCARHPSTVTYLRCANCNTPICARCQVMTPVGAKCPDCARVPVNPAFRLGVANAVVVAVICVAGGVILGVLASALAAFLAPLRVLLTVFFPAIAGLIMAEAIRWVVRAKRSVILSVLLVVGVLLAWIAMALGDFALHDPVALADPTLLLMLVRNLGIGSVLNPAEVLFVGLGIWIAIQRLDRI